MCVLLALECRAFDNKERSVDKTVCSPGTDLQSPADMLHFPLFSLCLSYFFTSVLFYRQGNMGG